jgi:hypothetical protein
VSVQFVGFAETMAFAGALILTTGFALMIGRRMR